MADQNSEHEGLETLKLDIFPDTEMSQSHTKGRDVLSAISCHLLVLKSY